MDMRIPPDAEVKARLLQNHDIPVGKRKAERVSAFSENSVRLKVAVMWIEHFGIMHMVWSAENSFDLDMQVLQMKMPEKKLAFAEDINEAGRTAIVWVADLARAFDEHLAKIQPCPIEFYKTWTDRSWPK